MLQGFFHKTEILEEATKDGEKGYLILKPFSFVREPNPSLGWPSWYAMDAVLVNVGWIPLRGVNHKYKYLSYEDPIIRNPISIYGWIRNLSNANVYEKEGVVLRKPKTITELWKEIDEKTIASDSPPYGLHSLPIYLDLIEGL
ncbi:SURF1 family cytochrome oxidase biogenesis protein [Leptospira tipperaryensis]|uniref:SURF1 family cytochrome oxidase biogenesis protein n=1 Tax=Leptospira tipperaryensis TaxID=2564040 RepID=UPI00138FCFF2|nr:SURF1 family cytochrome oxidase biogenesis protein [Leptospira tipperaryensis]